MRTAMICLATVLIAYFIAAVLIASSGKEEIRAVPLSPCQCKMQGGCLLQGKPKKGMSYDDNTFPGDYDRWKRYIGSDESVPQECRP